MLADINGMLGSGKTLLMTYVASKVKDRPVYANYKLNLPNYRPLKLEDLIKFTNEQALILVDEAYVLLESRNSMDRLNQYISYILFQSRKRGLDFMATAQLNSSLDLRYKELADINIYAVKTKKGFSYAIQYGLKAKMFELPFNQAKNYYGFYDTTELIIPIRMMDMVDEIENLDPDKLNEKVDDAVAKVFSSFSEELGRVKKVGHDQIRDFLLRLRMPASIEPYVYARVNERKTAEEQQ
jgi:hypothetical protein